MVPVFLDVEPKLRFPHCVTICGLAIAYTETAQQDVDGVWKPGLSPLFVRANNPFGMRWFKSLHSGDALPPYIVETSEIQNGVRVPMRAPFRHFPDLTRAVTAFGLLMLSRTYSPARAATARATVENPDYKLFALALGPKTSANDQEHCGYSTTPSYGANLISLVDQFRLFDPRALAWYATGRDPGAESRDPSQKELL